MLRPSLNISLVIFLCCSGCVPSENGRIRDGEEIETGYASYYASSLHGRQTASGASYDENKLTAAHRTLPFGTRVRVINEANKKSVVVTINDRGPFVRGRVIDLSKRAARELGILQAGVARVRVVRVSRD